MRRILIKARARLDILQIWLHIAKDSVRAAIHVEQKLEEEVRNLADMPGMGHRRRGLQDQQMRCWPFYSYLIFYKHDPKTITIIRVLHGRRKIGKRLPRR